MLAEAGVSAEIAAKLDWIGISGVGNLIGAIKFAKYFELGENDVVFTMFTDSMEMYGSRLAELTAARGAYDQRQADRDLEALRESPSTTSSSSRKWTRGASTTSSTSAGSSSSARTWASSAPSGTTTAHTGAASAPKSAPSTRLIEDFNAEVLR